MKILLTGHPRAGKSTLIEKTLRNFPGEIFGVIAQQILDNSGNRVGFKAVNLDGESEVIAHLSDIKSNNIIGGKYAVSLDAIDNFVVPEILKGTNQPHSLTIIDEVGRMQSISNKFLETVSALLQSKVHFFGTIVFDPEPWSLEFKKHPEVILIEVTEKNREALVQTLTSILKNIPTTEKLSPEQNQKITEMTREYLSQNQHIQVQKLFDNAIHYVSQGKVKKIGSMYQVIGNTDTHKVEPSKEGWQCDCHLFNGREMYTGKAGICSHIQGVTLITTEKE